MSLALHTVTMFNLWHSTWPPEPARNDPCERESGVSLGAPLGVTQNQNKTRFAQLRRNRNTKVALIGLAHGLVSNKDE